MFAKEPLVAVYVAPNVQAHLSAFSMPLVSYHAFRSGSVAVSSNSCAMTETMASAPGSPFGLLPVCSAQFPRDEPEAFPTNAYLMSQFAAPLVKLPLVCHPQYRVRNPEVSLMPGAVKTK